MPTSTDRQTWSLERRKSSSRQHVANPSSIRWQLEQLLAVWPNDPGEFVHRWSFIQNWPGILQCAARHGIVSLLSDALARIRGGNLSVIGAWESQAQLERIWDARLRTCLAGILATFQQKAISVIPLKGPILGERLYGAGSLRRSTDIDLLVATVDYDRAKQVLAALGYAAESGPTAQYQMRYHHHLTLTHAHLPPVELHFRLFTGFGIRLASEEYLLRARFFDSNLGLSIAVLSPEDELLYLCLHAAGHHFERLAWLYDIKSFILAHPDLRWPEIVAEARRKRAVLPLLYSLRVAFDRLLPEHPRPYPRLMRSMTRIKCIEPLHNLVESLPHRSRSAKAAALLFEASLCASAGVGCRHLAHHLARAAKRRVQRLLPRFAPSDWSG